jgi:hypothetical protein
MQWRWGVLVAKKREGPGREADTRGTQRDCS